MFTTKTIVTVMKSVVFVELFLTLGVTFATEVKSNQSESCYLSCTVEDLAKQRKIFKAEVSDKKARVVNMTVSIRLQQTEGDACRNMSVIDVATDSYFVWAASAKEPYLYVDWGFLQVVQRFSLHYGRMDIHVQCTLQNTSLSPIKENGTMPALPDVVMKSLMRVMETTGTLCSFTDNHSYKCCQLDETASKLTCSVIQPSEEWYNILSTIWGVISTLVVYYLPAVICLFPVWPRITEDGKRCIALRDPSPAGFRTLLVRFFVPENKDSLLNKARFFFLRAVLVPCMVTGFPFVLPCLIFYKEPFLYVSYALFFVSSSIYAITSLFFSSSGPINRTKCELCHNFLSEAVYHFHMGDTVKEHMYAILLGCVKVLREFTEWYIKKLKRLHSLRSFHSVVCTIWSVLLMGFVIPLVVIILLPLFFAAFIPFLVLSLFVLFSPFISIILHESCFRQFEFQIHVCSKIINCIVKACATVLLPLMFLTHFITTVVAVVRVFPYSILILIDNADAVFPVLAFILPIAYYLHCCFTSFSEKYQRLKIKLFREIENYRNGNERHGLLLYTTETGAIAIPEELFEKACRDLHMPMLREFSVALFPMIGLSLVAFSVFASIMVYGASTGISPLVRTVTIFLASSIPTIFQLFSFSKTDEELKEIDDEFSLKTVVATYAQRAQRSHGDEVWVEMPEHNTEARPQTIDAVAASIG